LSFTWSSAFTRHHRYAPEPFATSSSAAVVPEVQLDLATQTILQNSRLRKVLLRDGLAIALLLGLTASAFHRKGTTPLDRLFLGDYVPEKHSVTFRIAAFLTLLGSPGVVIVLGFGVAAVAWLRGGSRAWGLACLAAPGIAGVAESTLKLLIARPRPITAAMTGESAFQLGPAP
jgi:hypothetical protein